MPISPADRATRRARIKLTNGMYVLAIDVDGLRMKDISVHERGHVVTVRDKCLLETARFPDDADMTRLTALYRNGCVELAAPRRPVETHVVPLAAVRNGVHADVAPI